MSISQGQKITATDVNNHINNKSNPHEVTAEQVGAAASSHNHAASNITSGTLPVARGGTGVTSLDALKKSLGITGGLPAVSSANEGQVLRVVNGEWAVANAADSETFTGFVTVTHSYASRRSTMSISGVPFQPSKPWKSCIASLALLNDAGRGSYTLNSYGSVGTNSNVLLVGGYCRTGQNTGWTYQTWYLKLNSAGDTLSWVAANSNIADNHSDSGSFSWTFTVNITGYFA